MGTISQKLTYLNDTKQLLKENINNLGGNLTNEPFRQYASVLEGIYERIPKVSGIGANLSLSPSMVGKIKLNEIQGNTLQENTPTPDTPVEIQSVTGLQNVGVCGKNLLDTSSFYNDYVDSSGNIQSTGVQALFNYIRVNPGESYTISSQGTVNSLNIAQYDINKNFISRTVQSNNPRTFTLGNTTYYIRIWTKVSDDTPMTQEIVNGLKLQLEKNNQATTYEPYKGNTYEVNLGKNLIDITTLDYGYVGSNGSIVNSHNAGEMHSTFIKVNPNTTYTFKIFETSTTYNNWFVAGEYSSNSYSSFIQRDTMTTATQNYITFTTTSTTQYVRVSARNLENATKVQLETGPQATSYSPYFTPIELNKIGDYKDSIKKSTGKNLFDKSTIIEGKYIDASGNFINDNNNFIGDFISIDNTKSYYISASSGQAKRIAYYDSSKSFISRELISAVGGLLTIPNNAKYVRLSCYNVNLDSLQLEQNNQETTYEPYGKVWYVEKQIGKVVLDGSENWGMNTNQTYFFYNNNIFPMSSSGSAIYPMYSTHFISNKFDLIYNGLIDYGIAFAYNIRRMTIRNKDMATVEDFKTWLSTHNTTVLYQLATPIYEVITNTELIEDLESLNNAKSEDGTTNINVTSEDLSMILNVSVLKGDA